MDGETAALRERWKQRTDAAFERMLAGKSEEELVTFTEREDMAVLIGKELAAFLLEENLARDAAVEPAKAAATCCPKCGQPGEPAVRKGEKLVDRTVATRAGEVHMRRQRWHCAKCRIIFFSVGRAIASGNGRL
ncbi:MAG: hypothetical protein IT429_26360 [Gemmataceae bacterium]|nr:hypothetical protein [Gemmataceae bacterium]